MYNIRTLYKYVYEKSVHSSAKSMTFLTILWKMLVFDNIYNEPKLKKKWHTIGTWVCCFHFELFFKDCAPFVVSVSSRDLWRHSEVSRRLISTVAVGFPWIGRAQQLFRVVWVEYYEKSPY